MISNGVRSSNVQNIHTLCMNKILGFKRMFKKNEKPRKSEGKTADYYIIRAHLVFAYNKICFTILNTRNT